MSNASAPARESLSFDLTQARWVLHVLAPLIAVVGPDTLLGRILRHTRTEILSAVRDAAPAAGRHSARRPRGDRVRAAPAGPTVSRGRPARGSAGRGRTGPPA